MNRSYSLMMASSGPDSAYLQTSRSRTTCPTHADWLTVTGTYNGQRHRKGMCALVCPNNPYESLWATLVSVLSAIALYLFEAITKSSGRCNLSSCCCIVEMSYLTCSFVLIIQNTSIRGKTASMSWVHQSINPRLKRNWINLFHA